MLNMVQELGRENEGDDRLIQDLTPFLLMITLMVA